MLKLTEAIVLRRLKFQENSLIITLFTREFGVKPYLVRGVLKSKKGGLKAAHFQLLNQMEIVAKHNEKGSLNSIKELRVINPYTTLLFDYSKQSIAMFIADLLFHAIKEEQDQSDLFDFIKESLNWLYVSDNFVDFHLIFMMRLTRFLGFYPEDPTGELKVFDLREGKFVNYASNPFCLTNRESLLLQGLMSMSFADLSIKRFNNAERKTLLDLMLKYYDLHLPQFGQLKSYQVLKEVFK